MAKKQQATAAGVKVRYVGSSGVRQLDGYEWNAGNLYVQRVSPATAAALLTYPRAGQFALIAQPPLAAETTAALAAALGVTAEEITALLAEAPVVPVPALTEVGVSVTRAAELAALGVTDVAGLAALDADGLESLATRSGATRGQIHEWAAKARELVEVLYG